MGLRPLSAPRSPCVGKHTPSFSHSTPSWLQHPCKAESAHREFSSVVKPPWGLQRWRILCTDVQMAAGRRGFTNHGVLGCWYMQALLMSTARPLQMGFHY